MGLFDSATDYAGGLLDKAGSSFGNLFDSFQQKDGEFSYIEDEFGLPRGVLYALMMAESEQWARQGQPTPESPAGALGPFQLLPDTAESYGANPYNLHEAARVAANEIKRGFKKTGSLDQALATYNYGYGNADKQNFDLEKIDKFQKEFGDLIDEDGNPRSETTEHRKKFHKYFRSGEPEMNIDWMKSKSSNNAPQMYPPPKQLTYPPPQQQQQQPSSIVEHYPTNDQLRKMYNDKNPTSYPR
jgi:hypothetical protein